MTPPTRTRQPKRGVNKTTLAQTRTRGKDTGTLEAVRSVSPDKPLTDKQRLFTKYWAEGESILSAAARAGYTDGGAYAYRMVHLPNVLALKAQYAKKYEEESQMSRKKVMDMHLEAFEMAKLLSEPSSMVAAAREVGKLCGYYEPTRKEININVNGSVTMQQMTKLTDAELLKIIEEGTYESQKLGYEEDDVENDA